MGKFPVISVSLKGIDGSSYGNACEMAETVIREEAGRHSYLRDSDCLAPEDKKAYLKLPQENMSDAELIGSIRFLSQLLEKHFGEKVIILIDEYDVPLAKASEGGYYDEMVRLIRNMFGQALKTNDSLKFAVLTGCLRVSKESIFTGLNNTRVLSVMDVKFDEYFGFTNREVLELLEYYELSQYYDTIKEWYDGYRFGNVDVYCPWDVICYCDRRGLIQRHSRRNIGRIQAEMM